MKNRNIQMYKAANYLSRHFLITASTKRTMITSKQTTVIKIIFQGIPSKEKFSGALPEVQKGRTITIGMQAK